MLIIMVWKTVERPGPTGSKKAELIERLNAQYGVGNWRKVYVFNGRALDKFDAFQLCEIAYYHHSLDRPELWKKLIAQASDIYDMKPEEVESGLDYRIQHEFTRFHDICIRNVVFKRGWTFHGKQLVQIRFNPDGPNSWYSEVFDPGKVQFHLPHLIPTPLIRGWWNDYSVECAWQNIKEIQVKE
jgi:hypothetical protein